MLPQWIDGAIRVMFDIQRPDGVVEGWHGDGNFARTAIMYALWKSQGVTVKPWRSDVCCGAALSDGTLFVTVAADGPWEGNIVFDRPRHQAYLKLPLDYPRINQFPEWFTAKADASYRVTMGEAAKTYAGGDLWRGVAAKWTGDAPSIRVTVEPVK
jgi:hypothetical protein